MWGNINGSFYVDLQRAKVFNYDGAVKGPAFYSQPVDKILYERFGKRKNRGVRIDQVLSEVKKKNGISGTRLIVQKYSWL